MTSLLNAYFLGYYSTIVLFPLQIMSSKRKSPPTKLDGSNGISDSKVSEDVEVMPSAEIDLSIKSSPHFSDTETNNDHRISPDVDRNSEINHHNQLNGERTGGKSKRRGGDVQVSLMFNGRKHLMNI